MHVLWLQVCIGNTCLGVWYLLSTCKDACSLASGLHRQCLFGGLRIGLYEPVKPFYMGERPPGDAPLYLKVAAGLTTGALAIAIASPTDLVKVC